MKYLAAFFHGEGASERARSLSALRLGGCGLINDSTFTAFVVTCNLPALTVLHLPHCQNITDESLVVLAARCSGLTDLNLNDCSSVRYLLQQHAKSKDTNRFQILEFARSYRLARDSKCSTLAYLLMWNSWSEEGLQLCLLSKQLCLSPTNLSSSWPSTVCNCAHYQWKAEGV